MRTILNIFGHMRKYLLATLVRLPQTQPHKTKTKQREHALFVSTYNKNSRLSNISEESPSQFQTAGDKHGTIQNLFSFSLSPPQIKKLAGSPWDQPCDIFGRSVGRWIGRMLGSPILSMVKKCRLSFINIYVVDVVVKIRWTDRRTLYSLVDV